MITEGGALGYDGSGRWPEGLDGLGLSRFSTTNAALTPAHSTISSPANNPVAHASFVFDPAVTP